MHTHTLHTRALTHHAHEVAPIHAYSHTIGSRTGARVIHTSAQRTPTPARAHTYTHTQPYTYVYAKAHVHTLHIYNNILINYLKGRIISFVERWNIKIYLINI